MAFDSAIISYTTKTDKVDLVQAAHINAIQTELVTIETILGIGIKGTCSSLMSRLSINLDVNGALRMATSFPSSPIAGQLFFRSDLESLFLRSSGNSSWLNFQTSHAAGDVLTAQATTERTETSGSAVKKKEINVPKSGVLRIKFDLRRDVNDGGNNAFGQIYRNGSSVGTLQSATSTSYATFSEDISGWSAGDLLQLYAYKTGAAITCYIRNLKVYEQNGTDFIVLTD